MGIDKCEARRRGRNNQLAEPVNGGYTPLPWVVLDSEAYQSASFSAKALLNEFARIHNGKAGNNGHLSLTYGYLKPRGWRSPTLVTKAKRELQAHGLIVETRKGGLNHGPSMFALTWLPISNIDGLDISAKCYPRSAYLSFCPEPLIPKKQNADTDSVLVNGVTDTDSVLATPSTDTDSVPVRGVFGDSTSTDSVHKEYIPFPDDKNTSTEIHQEGQKQQKGPKQPAVTCRQCSNFSQGHLACAVKAQQVKESGGDRRSILVDCEQMGRDRSCSDYKARQTLRLVAC